MHSMYARQGNFFPGDKASKIECLRRSAAKKFAIFIFMGCNLTNVAHTFIFRNVQILNIRNFDDIPRSKPQAGNESLHMFCFEPSHHQLQSAPTREIFTARFTSRKTRFGMTRKPGTTRLPELKIRCRFHTRNARA